MRIRLLAVLLAFLTPAVAYGGVGVVVTKPVVEHKTFDPANPPRDMPPLRPGEIAVTGSLFNCRAAMNFEVASSKPTDSGAIATIAVHGLTITTTLHITVWLPENVTEKIKAHEEGHRRIAELIYNERAKQMAKAAGALVDGKRIDGDGANRREASNNAIQAIMNKVGRSYLDQTATVSSEINDMYDQITQHGTNSKPEDAAIKEAFSRYDEKHPATKPAQK